MKKSEPGRGQVNLLDEIVVDNFAGGGEEHGRP